MTPKEKAIELYVKYRQYTFYVDLVYKEDTLDKFYENAKSCARIAVNELIYFGNTELLSEMFEGDYYCDVDFFEAVKQEIEKL